MDTNADRHDKHVSTREFLTSQPTTNLPGPETALKDCVRCGMSAPLRECGCVDCPKCGRTGRCGEESTEAVLDVRYIKFDPLLSSATEYGRSSLDVTDNYRRLVEDRDYLDELQAIFQTGIGLARLELSGVKPDPARAMEYLNQSVEKSDALRRSRCV